MSLVNRVFEHPLRQIAGRVLLCTFIANQDVASVATGRPRPVYVFTMTAPIESKDLAYQDQTVRMAFRINRADVVLSILNLAKSPIRVNWNEVAYVDPDGHPHDIVHSRQPAVLPPTANLTDSMVPADFIYSNGAGKLTAWQQRDLFPKPTRKEARKYDGRSFSLYIPIEIDGAVRNYLLTFAIRINDA